MMNLTTLARVRKVMGELGLEQLIVTQPQSIYYLTGEWVNPLDRLDALIITDADVSMLCYNLAVIRPQNCKTVIYSDMAQALPCLVKMLKNATTGIDGDMPSRFSLPLMELMGMKMVASDCVLRARMIKDSDEIARLKHASELTDSVFDAAFAGIEQGMSEIQIARLFAEQFERSGAGVFQGLPMAACGAGTSDVHHSTGNYRVRQGDAIMVDTGMRIDGYYSDTTRTIFMGECSREQRQIYDIVLEANMAAIDAVKPGALLGDVDAAARHVIQRAGYGEYFTHKTSHGVGIDFHELPTDRADAPTVLEPGMAFSIEPGIYLENNFGVRIEDLAIVTPTGVDIATHCNKQLRII